MPESISTPLTPSGELSPEAFQTYLNASLRALQDEIEKFDEVVPGEQAAASFEELRQRWGGRKTGVVTQISHLVKQAPTEHKRAFGISFNEFKDIVSHLLDGLQTRIQDASTFRRVLDGLDISLPGIARTPGIAHPLLTTMERIVEVFHHLGYSTELGPQVESDFYNFEALNFPENHPARDTQDTLQIAGQEAKPSRDRLLLRTHTSPVQIRTMVAQDPPLRIVIPGKVHRNEAADATHSPTFHQVEGLCVGPDITFSDLKGTLDHAMRALFGSGVKTRFFPSFFPFTEPSADVQISCIFCGGSGCRKCKHSGWIELLGCGMVDPAVFQAVAGERRRLGLDDGPYDPARVSGFAFGMGVERIAMILHGVSDIGTFYSGDMRFLEQFA
jgi:phenylalanyl-tRNA synthetase alpha chain